MKRAALPKSSAARNLSAVVAEITDTRFAILIFSISFFVRCAVVFWFRLFVADRTEGVNVAFALATTGKFANPFATAATGPTAHLAPIYPFLLSLVYRLVGAGSPFLIAKSVLASALVSIQYALLPLACRLLNLPRLVGIAAGICAAALPLRMWIETSGGHETPLSGLASIALIPWTAAIMTRAGARGWQRVACGVGWGLGLLINTALATALVAILAVICLRNSSRAMLSSAVLIVAIAGLTISPWIVRNYLALDWLVPVRDNFGLELAVSNNSKATAVMEWNTKSAGFMHPYKSLAEGLRMRDMGEKKYYRARMTEAVAWIRADFGSFLWLTAQRIVFFWFSPAADTANNIFLSILTLGGFGGVYLLYSSNRQTALILGSIWIAYQIPYYFVQVSPRYRFPIDWSFWLLGMYAVVRLSGILVPRNPQEASRNAAPSTGS